MTAGAGRGDVRKRGAGVEMVGHFFLPAFR
jgi:hypothetical protein